MKAKRFSIAGLMGLVLIVALSLTAFRSGSAAWAGATVMATAAILTLGVVGALVRKGGRRAWWLGFALFGWGYLTLLGRLPWGTLLTGRLMAAIRPASWPGAAEDFGPPDLYPRVGHCLFSLMAAVLGGLLASWLFGVPAASASASSEALDPRPEPPVTRNRWRQPAVVGSAGLAVLMFGALLGLVGSPGTRAAVALFSTWGWLGVAVVGAACGRGKRRAAWLGTALFGLTYMILIFGQTHARPGYTRATWLHVATGQFLHNLRPWFPRAAQEFPPASDTIVAANNRILKALDQLIRMPFDRETPLQEVLKYIRAATSEPDYPGIPIYVDPIGLQEAEKTMDSPIKIDLEGVPLRTSLQLGVAQLGMHFTVKDGLLIINSMTSDDETWDEFFPFQEDPYLVVGHCLLALIAATLGGTLAPLVADP